MASEEIRNNLGFIEVMKNQIENDNWIQHKRIYFHALDISILK